MTERAFPFDAQDIDRYYTAIDWQRTLFMFSDNGIIFNWDNDMQVKATTPNMRKVQVTTGAMVNEGIFYQIYDDPIEIDIPANPEAFNRIDLIYVEHDKQLRTMSVQRKEGTPASTPQPPEIVNNEDFREFELAYVTVPPSSIKIKPENIEDRRFMHPEMGDSVHVGHLTVLGDAVVNNPQHSEMLGDFNMGGNQIKEVGTVEFNDRVENGRFIRFEPRYEVDGENSFEFTFVEEATNTENDVMDVFTDSRVAVDRLAGLANLDVIGFGISEEASYISTRTDGIRLLFDSLSYLKVSPQAVTFFFDDDDNGDATATHIFYSSGNKVAGSINIDGTRWGMSPTDSPRSLISDIMQGVKVDGTATYHLPKKLRNVLHSFAVFPSNPNVKVKKKTAESFTVEGTGTCDFKIIGKRIDKHMQYFSKMFRNRA